MGARTGPRRLRKTAAHLEITAFINLIVVLVPFLLSTTVFSRLAVMDVNLPAPSSATPAQLRTGDLQLEVVIRPDALEVGDRMGGLIQRINNTPAGHDVASLAALMGQLKTRFPDQTEASVLAEPNTSYDMLVQVMDAVRTSPAAAGQPRELFPAIAVGDAPLKAGGKG
jgi:biopolymer transport protein ExbD